MIASVPSVVRRGGLLALVLLLGVVQPGRAQLSDLDVRVRGGLALPSGDFSEYFSAGPTFGVDLLHPLRDDVALLADIDLESLNRQASYVPDTRLVRYQLGAEAELLSGWNEHLRLAAYAGAGATSFRSDDFVTRPPPHERTRFSRTAFTGTGGVRLGFDTETPLTWWLSGEFNWAPTDEEDAATLRSALPYELDTTFESASHWSLSLGVDFRG